MHLMRECENPCVHEHACAHVHKFIDSIHLPQSDKRRKNAIIGNGLLLITLRWTTYEVHIPYILFIWIWTENQFKLLARIPRGQMTNYII